MGKRLVYWLWYFQRIFKENCIYINKKLPADINLHLIDIKGYVREQILYIFSMNVQLVVLVPYHHSLNGTV